MNTMIEGSCASDDSEGAANVKRRRKNYSDDGEDVEDDDCITPIAPSESVAYITNDIEKLLSESNMMIIVSLVFQAVIFTITIIMLMFVYESCGCNMKSGSIRSVAG